MLLSVRSPIANRLKKMMAKDESDLKDLRMPRARHPPESTLVTMISSQVGTPNGYRSASAAILHDISKTTSTSKIKDVRGCSPDCVDDEHEHHPKHLTTTANTVPVKVPDLAKGRSDKRESEYGEERQEPVC
jgi:hypothetical protein